MGNYNKDIIAEVLMNNTQCEICGEEVVLPFKCSYCGGLFCGEHRLPERHNCTDLPKKNPHRKERTERYQKLSEYYEYHSKKRHSKKRVIKKIVKFSVITIIAIFLISTAYFTLQQLQLIQNPSTPNMPTLTPYVEVNYEVVGWFFGESIGYNYTYLVLDVTITNYKCSEIYINGDYGFTVVVNNKIYKPAIESIVSRVYGFSEVSEFYQDKFRIGGWEGRFLYSFYLYNDVGLPNQATLLDTGSVSGIIIFKFGDPTVIPQQPQILNKPFVLQYSSKAKVVINQIG